MTNSSKPIDDNIKKTEMEKEVKPGPNDAITFRDEQINYWKERAKDNKGNGGPRKTSGTGGTLNFGGSVLGRVKRTYSKDKNRVVTKGS